MQIGGFESLEELRDIIRKREEASATDLSNQIAESRLIQEIVSRSTVNFPEVLVREEVEDELRQLSNQLQQNRMSYQQYLEQLGQTPEQYQSGLASQAAEKVRSILALRQIAQQEGLQIANEAIDAELERMRDTGQISDEQYDEYLPDARRRLQVANALVQQRLHDFLFANNTINEVEQQKLSDLEAIEASEAIGQAEAQPVAAEESQSETATKSQAEAQSDEPASA